MIAEARIKNQRREIWIKVSDPQTAQELKRLAERNSTVWIGGQVIPDEKKVHGFYFNPATILIKSDSKYVANLIQVTLEKISRDVEYYNKHGLMTPNRWFIKGQVLDYR